MAALPVENYLGNPSLVAQATLGLQLGTLSFTYSPGDPARSRARVPHT